MPARNLRNAPRWRVIVVVLVIVLGASGAAASVAGKQESEPLTFVAQLEDASALLQGNDVKVDGVVVGEILGMSVEDGYASVSFTANAEALPLHKDATVAVQPVSLLGERYLRVDPGSPSAPRLANGDVIPASQTSDANNLHQLLNVLDTNTSKALASLVTVLGQGVRGNGKEIANTIKALGPAMTDTERLVEILNKQNATLNRLVDNVAPVARSLARNKGKTMDGLVESARQVLSTTGSNRRALQAVMAELPSTLAEARKTFAHLAGTANATTPALKAIRPTTDNLLQISRELEEFSRVADPALTRVRPVLKKAEALLDAARPVAAELQKSGNALVNVASSAEPIATRLAENFNHVMNFIRGWALATNGKDGLGHYFRAATTVTPEIVTGLLPANKGKAPSGSKNGDKSETPTQPIPGTGKLPDVKGLLPQGPATDEGATGMNQKQERGLMDFLLGGN